MARLPSSDELGRMLEKGEISREEAVEIMAQRARMGAFGAMNRDLKRAAGPELGRLRSDGAGPSRDLVLTLVAVVGGIAAALGVMIYVMYRLFASAP